MSRVAVFDINLLCERLDYGQTRRTTLHKNGASLLLVVPPLTLRRGCYRGGWCSLPRHHQKKIVVGGCFICVSLRISLGYPGSSARVRWVRRNAPRPICLWT